MNAIIIDTKTFTRELEWVARFIERKTTIPILSNVLFQKRGDYLTLPTCFGCGIPTINECRVCDACGADPAPAEPANVVPIRATVAPVASVPESASIDLRTRAIALRRQKVSLKAIAAQLSAPQSSVWRWTREA